MRPTSIGFNKVNLINTLETNKNTAATEAPVTPDTTTFGGDRNEWP
jgi:hypothetical protein